MSKINRNPFNPYPYIKGVYIENKYDKYHLLHTVWSVKQADGSFSYLWSNYNMNDALYSYDVVIATVENIYGPYSER